MPATYIQGSLVRVSVIFTVSGVLTDPSIVRLKYKNPAGTTTTWVYLTDAQLVRDGVGQYRADIDANAGGTWNWRWEGTGAAQGADQDTFTVTAATV